MAITSEIIGKLGGSEVKITNVSVSNVSGTDTAHQLAHVNVQGGKQCIVSLIGTFSATTSGLRAPEFQIGADKNATSGIEYVNSSMSAVVAAPSDVSIVTHSSTSISFSGKVYVTEI